MKRIKRLGTNTLVMLISLMLLTGCTPTINLTKITTEGVQIGNDFLIKVTNGYNEGKDVGMKITFYDEAGKVISEMEDTALCVPSHDTSIALVEDIIDTNFATYKVQSSSQSSVYVDRTKDLLIKTDVNDKKENPDVDITIKNKGNEAIDVIEITTIFYKNDVPVGYDWLKHNNLMAGSERTLTANVPKDDDGKRIEYTRFEIFQTASQN